jgi:hypothetical protein
MAATTTTGIERVPRAALVPSRLVGGIGGLVFVATVIIQNSVRATAPSFDAAPADVIHFYAGHHGALLTLAILFPFGATGLASFIAGLGTRLAGSATRAPALAGVLGAAGIFATYTMLMATELALGTYVRRGAPDSGVVTALWITHNTVFGVLLVSIAVALAGLSAAAAATRFVPAAWKPLGSLGALALAATGAATPALVNGSPILALGVGGFVVWVLFVATCAVTLLRARTATEAATA